MKLSWLFVISVLALQGAASAQRDTVPQSTAPRATVVHSREIRASLERAKPGALSDAMLRVVPVESKYNIAVAVVRRSRISGHPPTGAFVHDDVTEVYQIIEGSGVLVTGGKLRSGKPVTGGKILSEIGPSSQGKGIVGGTRTSVGPGDIVVIPPHTPHGFVEISTKQIVYTIIRVDPKRVLTLDGDTH